MRKSLSYLAASIFLSCISIAAFAQTTVITGNITNSGTKETVSAVSVTVKGTSVGTYTDDRGNFKLSVNQAPPITLVITSVGFEMQEVVATSNNELLNISLLPTNILGEGITIAATRTPSRILESPVTIERISAANIRNSAIPDYYGLVQNLKGVDMVTASLNFKTPTTRGFGGSGNTRLNQIVDGMDNQAPGLNFSLGSVVGLTELDVESVELLPGASSALYGPGGMNGALIINSKDPFKYQGLSFQAKTGIMHIGERQRAVSPYYNWALRWAKKVSDKFAFKVGGEVIQAKDWLGDDYRNYRRIGTTGSLAAGTRETDPNYDGVNVYGDETTIDLRSNVLNALAAALPFYAPYVNALPATMPVSRTGYVERDVVNPNTVNLKLSAGTNYRITNRLSFILAGHWGTGNTVYTGSDRYSLKNLKMGQYKAELLHNDWFVRAFTTQENAGEAYNATVTTRLFNEAWKPSGGQSGWYFTYGAAFLANKLSGATDMAAHNAARAAADVGRPVAGSAQFNRIFDQVRQIPIKNGGGRFVDRTNLYNIEGQYNFTSLTKGFAEIIAGANYKRYVLNSEGTLFADSAGKIGINEMGIYTQITKRLMDDKLKLIGSMRYDKNENFEGKFTPRVSAVVRVAPDNNVRLTYQTAYRFPTTQQQWINLRVGGGTFLIGGLETFKTRYNFAGNKIYSVESVLAGAKQERTFAPYNAESVQSFEGGYKGLLLNKKLLVDVYGYYGIYTNFLVRTLVAQAVSGNPNDITASNISNPALVTVYSVPTNATGDVKTHGFGASFNYSFPNRFYSEINFSSDKLKGVPSGLIASFNAPEWRAGVTIGNTGIGKDQRLGFNLAYRWQDAFFFEGDFANGPIDPINTVDGQISYRFPQQKLMLKLGGSNLLNQYYRNGFGNATVGGLYYISFGYNL